MLKRLFIYIWLMFGAASLFAAGNMLKNPDFQIVVNGNPESWLFVSAGYGKFQFGKEDDGAKYVEIKISPVPPDVLRKGIPTLMSGGWSKEQMLPLKTDAPLRASVLARSPDGGVAQLAVVSRNSEAKWLAIKESPPVTLNNTWQKLEITTLPSADAAYLQFNAMAISGTVQFKAPELCECTMDTMISRRYAEPEFWINVDYNDEFTYCKNIGAATYEEAEIARFFQQCAQYKVTGVHWRVSVLGTFDFPTKEGTIYPGRVSSDKLDHNQQQHAAMLKRIDPLLIAIREARKNKIKIYIWTTIMDEYSTDKNNPELLTNPLIIDHPEYMLLDKKGSPQKGSLCYNIPEVRQYRLNIIRELVKYQADGIYMCTRTHAFYYGADSGDKYGYNPVVVKEYQERYGVDIMTQNFDRAKWQDIKAEGLDKLFAETAEIVHSAGQKVRLSVKTVQNEDYGWPFGGARMYWKNWIKKGLVDSIVVGHYYIPYDRIIDDTRSFREFATPGQQIFFWMQLWHYQKSTQTPLKDLLRQIRIVAAAGADGVLCHEAIGLEERVDTYWKPLADAVNKYWHSQAATGNERK